MNTKTRIVLTGIGITAILMFAYITLRSGVIEKEYAGSLGPLSDRIAFHLKNFEKDKGIRDKNLSKFLEEINIRYQPIAVLAIADKSNTLLAAGKNGRFIATTETFDAVISTFTRGDFRTTEKAPFGIRYYNQTKYYVFVKDVQEGRMLILFPYRLRGKLLARLLLELLLIMILSVIFTTAIYLYLQRSGRIRNMARYRVIPLTRKKPGQKPEEDKITGNIAESAAESLRRYVFDLFAYIDSNFHPGSISLYVVNRSSTSLEKLFEKKGEMFIRIDNADFERQDLDNETGEELKKSSIMVLQAGKKIVIPVLYRNSLLATLNLERDTGFRGPEISDIRLNAQKIVRALSEYLLLGDIVVDAGTGLFSKTWFQLKYDELLAQSQSGGSSFGVVFLSLFDSGAELEPEQKNIAFRSISRQLVDFARKSAIFGRYDDYISVLLPEATSSETVSLGLRLRDELSKTKIRLDRKHVLDLKPFVGVSSSDEKTGRGNPLEEALANLRYAGSQGDQSLYSV